MTSEADNNFIQRVARERMAAATAKIREQLKQAEGRLAEATYLQEHCETALHSLDHIQRHATDPTVKEHAGFAIRYVTLIQDLQTTIGHKRGEVDGLTSALVVLEEQA